MSNLILKHPFFEPVRHYNFRQLCINAVLHDFGVGGERLVLGLLVFQIADSSAWVGITLALYFTPMLFVGGPAGAIADWMDRRRLLRIIEVLLAINLCVFGLLVALQVIEIWQVLVMTVLSGSIHAMHQPVRSSYAYDIVGGESVVAGLSFLNIAKRVGQLLGALIAGSLMQRYGAEGAYFLLGGTHLLASLLLGKLRPIDTSGEMQDSISLWQNVVEYLGEMRHNRVLLMLVVVTASVEVFGFSFMTALPEIATEKIGVGAEGLGWLHGAGAFGGFSAGLLLANWGKRGSRGIIYLFVISGFCLSLLFLAIVPSLLLALFAVGLVAGMATASDILSQSMMQLSVPDRLRGRAMGAWTFAIGSAPLGHLEMGFLVSRIGTTQALMINAGALVLVGGLTFLLAPQIRKL